MEDRCGARRYARCCALVAEAPDGDAARASLARARHVTVAIRDTSSLDRDARHHNRMMRKREGAQIPPWHHPDSEDGETWERSHVPS